MAEGKKRYGVLKPDGFKRQPYEVWELDKNGNGKVWLASYFSFYNADDHCERLRKEVENKQ